MLDTYCFFVKIGSKMAAVAAILFSKNYLIIRQKYIIQRKTFKIRSQIVSYVFYNCANFREDLNQNGGCGGHFVFEKLL